MLEIGMVHKTLQLYPDAGWHLTLCGPKLVCQIIQLPQEVPLPMLQVLQLPFKPDVCLLCYITSGSFSQGA